MAKASKGIDVVPRLDRDAARVLTAAALPFIAGLHRTAADHYREIITSRSERFEQFAGGEAPGFRLETGAIRAGNWKIATPPRELSDQRTAVAVPPSRKELLSGLNSGARLCLADFHDASPPVWDLLIDGQINLMDRWTSAMEHVDQATGRRVSLSQKLAALMVRVRPLTQDEPRVKIDGKPISAGLFDAGLYLFHNARTALAKASGPWLCLPDIRSQAEARLWNDLLVHAQSLLGLAAGTIRVNVMIDSPPAAFEIDEIAYELREHLCGAAINGQRYEHSLMGVGGMHKPKPIGGCPEQLLSYVVRALHRRGGLAIASAAHESEAPRAFAEYAVREGADGILLANPDQAGAAAKVFNDDMPTPNQIYVSRDDVHVESARLLLGANAALREESFRVQAGRSLRFLEGWLSGAARIMPMDAAVFEATRTQLWHAIKLGVKFDGGVKANEALLEDILLATMKQVKEERGEEAYRSGRFREASALLRVLVLSKDWIADFMPLAMRKLQ